MILSKPTLLLAVLSVAARTGSTSATTPSKLLRGSLNENDPLLRRLNSGEEVSFSLEDTRTWVVDSIDVQVDKECQILLKKRSSGIVPLFPAKKKVAVQDKGEMKVAVQDKGGMSVAVKDKESHELSDNEQKKLYLSQCGIYTNNNFCSSFSCEETAEECVATCSPEPICRMCDNDEGISCPEQCADLRCFDDNSEIDCSAITNVDLRNVCEQDVQMSESTVPKVCVNCSESPDHQWCESESPSQMPSGEPTGMPSGSPSGSPSEMPSQAPTTKSSKHSKSKRGKVGKGNAKSSKSTRRNRN